MISGVGEIVTDIEKRTTMLPGQSIGEAIPRIRSDGVLLVRVEEFLHRATPGRDCPTPP